MPTPLPTPLPKVDSPQVQLVCGDDSSHLSAYKVCLKYEEGLADCKDKLRRIRIVGFFLLHAPTQTVRSAITKHILSHGDGSELVDLGAMFERDVIGRFARSGSEPPWDLDDINLDTTRAPKGRREAKYRALVRDSWSCVVTGWMDRRCPKDTDIQIDPERPAVYTHCAHIVPETMVPKKTKPDSSSSAPVLAVLHEIHTIVGDNVHALANVLSMEGNVHTAFNMLELYFEATPQRDSYQVICHTLPPELGVREHVTFSTPDPVHLPVAAPELLALHATCCKVAHLSGVTEHVNSLHRNADD